jgi:hypothetical protein
MLRWWLRGALVRRTGDAAGAALLRLPHAAAESHGWTCKSGDISHLFLNTKGMLPCSLVDAVN